MGYRVVFANGENREIQVPATKIRFMYDSKGLVIELIDDSSKVLAVTPTDRVLYIRREE